MKLDGPVLGIHLTTRGYGWVLFESPNLLSDWGTSAPQAKDKNAACELQIKRLLTDHQPDVVAIEQSAGEDARRGARIKRLTVAIAKAAKASGATVAQPSRAEIRSSLGLPPMATREDTAQAVANRLSALASRLPAKRKIWESEHPNLSLFSAAASALTWFNQPS